MGWVDPGQIWRSFSNSGGGIIGWQLQILAGPQAYLNGAFLPGSLAIACCLNALAIFGGINPLISETNALAVWSYIGLVLLFFGMLLAFFGLIRKAQIASAFPLYPIRLEG
jgi:hypothetical protein